MPFVVDHTPVDLGAAMSIQAGRVAKNERDREFGLQERQADRQDLLAEQTRRRTDLAQQGLALDTALSASRTQMDRAKYKLDRERYYDERTRFDRQANEQRQRLKSAEERFGNALQYAQESGFLGDLESEDPNEQMEMQGQIERLQAQFALDPEAAITSLDALIKASHKQASELALRENLANNFPAIMQFFRDNTPLTDADIAHGQYMIQYAGTPYNEVVDTMMGIANGTSALEREPVFVAMNGELEKIEKSTKQLEDYLGKMADPAESEPELHAELLRQHQRRSQLTTFLTDYQVDPMGAIQRLWELTETMDPELVAARKKMVSQTRGARSFREGQEPKGPREELAEEPTREDMVVATERLKGKGILPPGSTAASEEWEEYKRLVKEELKTLGSK